MMDNLSGTPSQDVSSPFVVVHVIPYDGMGGVETAARSLPAGRYGPIRFEKCFLTHKNRVETREGEYHGHGRSENDLRAYMAAMVWILRRQPDLIIASLWRSCAVLLLAKLLRPRTMAITFLHLDRDVHWVDRIMNGFAARLSTEVWADSKATLDARLPIRLRSRGRVISMRTVTFGCLEVHPPQPRFVFWGRLHAQKGLSRALRLFALVRSDFPTAGFAIIGPDGGERLSLERKVRELGLEGAVQFLGPKPQPEAFAVGRECSFYLQTSEMEGFGMSVAEAMQLGLVPVVTPVGEIASYCREGENAILVRSDEDAVGRIREALENPSIYERLSRSAASTSNDQLLYKDDVLAACRDIARSNS